MGETNFYTGRGDRGDTSRLEGQERVAKSSTLIEALGTVDEATSAIGLARASAQTDRVRESLPVVQHHLYRLMSHLSATPEARATYPGLSEEDVSTLERLIAELEAGVPQIKGFVLPGDSVVGGTLHVARTVVRRAERRLAAFAEEKSSLGDANLAYLNRLSSLMFVAALYEEAMAGTSPTLAAHEGES